MGNVVANIADWYVNALNKLHLVPVNAATLMRDISAKQLSDGNFTPRPLTADNFTDAELDALYRLMENGKAKGAVSSNSYRDVAKGDFDYGGHSKGMKDYLSPLRSVSTTLGRASLSKSNGDYILKDTYDFNSPEVLLLDQGDGYLRDPATGDMNTREDAIKAIKDRGMKRTDAYSRFRSNAAELGHSDNDPDHQKIHAKLSLNDIKKRLGDKAGKLNITSPVPKHDFVLNSIGAGALAGAPLGAALGTMSGAILMLSKKRRKKWFRTMLTHALAGAGIGAALGGAGGGLASSGLYDLFEKKSADVGAAPDDKKAARRERARRERIKDAIIQSLAYTLPVAALAGTAMYGGSKYNSVLGKMLRDVDDTRNLKMTVV